MAIRGIQGHGLEAELVHGFRGGNEARASGRSRGGRAVQQELLLLGAHAHGSVVGRPGVVEPPRVFERRGLDHTWRHSLERQGVHVRKRQG